jgi:hypothetical protein
MSKSERDPIDVRRVVGLLWDDYGGGGGTTVQ